jgi:hypothetical protein
MASPEAARTCASTCRNWRTAVVAWPSSARQCAALSEALQCIFTGGAGGAGVRGGAGVELGQREPEFATDDEDGRAAHPQVQQARTLGVAIKLIRPDVPAGDRLRPHPVPPSRVTVTARRAVSLVERPASGAAAACCPHCPLRTPRANQCL